MEDSTWEGWTTPPQQPAGFELGYPEGRMLPSPPAAGWQGEVRASACSGRFALHPSGAMSLHDAAEIDQREVLDSPAPERSGLPGSE